MIWKEMTKIGLMVVKTGKRRLVTRTCRTSLPTTSTWRGWRRRTRAENGSLWTVMSEPPYSSSWSSYASLKDTSSRTTSSLHSSFRRSKTSPKSWNSSFLGTLHKVSFFLSKSKYWSFLNNEYREMVYWNGTSLIDGERAELYVP